MESTAKLNRLRIMVVEDNAHMMMIVKTILRGFGFQEFTEARSIGDAWERLRQEAVDILLLDRALGKEDGLDLVRRLRMDRDSPNPYLPIIMLSAHSERSRVEEARDAGVTEFCAKPVTARDLWGKVAAVIDRPRSFVRTAVYFGPDRRRRALDSYEGEKRRQDDPDAAQNAA